MSKKIKIIVIVIALLIIALAAAAAVAIALPSISSSFEMWDQNLAYEANWGFRLSVGVKPLYTAPSDGGFQGDGVRYHVYDTSDASDIFAKGEYSLSFGSDGAFEDAVLDVLSRRADGGGAVDEEFALRFPDEYYYLMKKDDDDTLYLILVEKRLYVVEDFI